MHFDDLCIWLLHDCLDDTEVRGVQMVPTEGECARIAHLATLASMAEVDMVDGRIERGS